MLGQRLQREQHLRRLTNRFMDLNHQSHSTVGQLPPTLTVCRVWGLVAHL
jgi:hypothetical protein